MYRKPVVRGRSLAAMGAATVVALVALSTPAAASRGDQGTTTPSSANPDVVLPEVEALAGTSIAMATNDADNPYTPGPTGRSFGTDGSEEANTRLTNGELVSEIVLSVGGARSIATIKAQVCPNDRGVVTAHVSMIVGSATADDRGIEAVATGRANDNAQLTSPAVEIARGTRAEAKLLKQVGRAVLRHSEAAWRNGLCVKIEVSEGESRQVKPKEKVPITATAIPRFGGGTITGRMESQLINGQKKVTPATASGSPAKFTYTAPNKKPDKGSVELKSTSRRGIGRTKLEYTTESDLKVDAPYQGFWQLTALKCGGPVGAWEITGSVSDLASGSETITFTLPEGKLSGAWKSTGQVTAAGASRPINEGGTVTYQEAPDGSGGTLTFSPGGGSVPVTSGKFCDT